jgi:hypothetical protein
MTDQMPVDLFGQSLVAVGLLEELSHLRRDSLQLLDTILTQFGVPQSNNLSYGVNVGRLGDNDELNLVGLSADPDAGSIDGVPDMFQFCSNFCHKRLQRAKIYNRTNHHNSGKYSKYQPRSRLASIKTICVQISVSFPVLARSSLVRNQSRTAGRAVRSLQKKRKKPHLMLAFEGWKLYTGIN